MECQKHLFDLEEGVHYLNGAYMSPSLNSVSMAGVRAVQSKARPYKIGEEDFFEPVQDLKSLFAELIGGQSEQIALIPSVSYGMQNAINNIPTDLGSEVITVGHEFPSDFYSLKSWADLNKKQLITVTGSEKDDDLRKKSWYWTNRILHAITEETAVVVMSSVHWMDGTLFDLKAIGERCQQTDTYFLVDGTQSVGALGIDVRQSHIDALVCGAYKWLLGPYSTGLAYYSERFNTGKPIEESWMNRTNARNFSSLTDYTDAYGPGASRYNMGEFSNFIAVPMLTAALKQIHAWGTANIQQYLHSLNQPLLDYLESRSIAIADADQMPAHLLGLKLPSGLNPKDLLTEFKRNRIFLSVREDSLRISPHVYNNAEDISQLIKILDEQLPN